MNLFAGTAVYYDLYRPGIPPEVVKLLRRAGGAGRQKHLLDLGTGTGQVIEPLLDDFTDIIAVDPDEKMLRYAEKRLRPQLPANAHLHFLHAPAEEAVLPANWQASLVTVCRAFHWMDHQRILAKLTGIIEPEGSIAIFGDGSLWTLSNPWADAIQQVIQSYLGEKRRTQTGFYTPGHKPYRQLLEESVFSEVREYHAPIQRTWSTERILGYLYSSSFAAKPLFGGRLAEFEAELKRTLQTLSPDDTFIEQNEFEVLIARRPR